MDKQVIEKHLSNLKGSIGSYPFGPEVLVFKVMNKMFALIAKKDDKSILTLKASPANVEFLTCKYDDITPGYHMNKEHWITIYLTGEVSESEILKLIDESYSLIVSKLTKDKKLELMAL
ncbi:MAG TPA: hypothetical protein DCL21_02340 [Alphaproteobacteria bacterium]|nr:hypothetical protein [Alphaproteobacteria bacterium]